MNVLMIVLLSQLNRPFAAVSKPTIQVWASLKRRFKAPHIARLLASELGEAAGTATASKATELREEAAAKFKEAHDYIDTKVKDAGKTMDDLKDDESIVSETDLATFDGLLDEAKILKKSYDKANKSEGRVVGLREDMDYFHGKATGKPVNWDHVQTRQTARKTLGQQFIATESYLDLLRSGALMSESASFKTERVMPQGLMKEYAQLQKAALEDTDGKALAAFNEFKAAGDIITSDTEGAALILDDFLPGIVQLRQRPLTIRELFASGTTTSDTVSYAKQSAFESGAATVAQADGTGASPSGGVKPQSSIAWTRTTSPVETIATYMAATRQQLADAGQVQSLIDSQGRLMLQLEEEDQILSGDGSSPNLQGVLGETGVQTLTNAAGSDADDASLINLKSIRTAKRMTMTGTARMAADAVVMNPSDSEEFDLSTDNDKNFRGGNPVGNFTFGQGLWGLRRVESEAISAGTVLVGSFQAATVLERMPITVYTTDSHSDWFTRNIIAVLFEERIGFPIFYPAAFVKITLNLWAGGT